jgi:DNA-binding transcriptional LysR family regulator
MADEARAFRASAEDTSKVMGLVRITTTEAMSAMLVREGLLRLRDRHPRLALELYGGNRVLDLTRGEADIALRVVKVAEPSLRVRRVAKLPFALFASESYVRQRGRPRMEADLAGHDVIAMAGELSNLPESRFLESRPGVTVSLRTNSMTAMLTAVQDGYGIGAITGPWGERELGLVKLMDLPSIPPRPLFLAMHPDAAARPAVRVVADAITEILSVRGTSRA